MKNITIKDIAKEAGVSTSCVSFVLNNSGHVSKKTKEKILKIIEKNNYKPSSIARAVRTKKTKNILFLTNFLIQPASVEAIAGIEKRLSESNYNLSVIDIMDKFTSNISIKDKIDVRNYDGIIIGSISNKDFFKIIDFLNIAIFTSISIDLAKDNYLKNAAYINLDNYQGGKIAAQHLIENNHKRIGIILHLSEIIEDFKLRKEGFVKGLNSRKIELSFEFEIPLDLMSLQLNIRDFLLEKKDLILSAIKDKKITAFFVTTDLLAMNIINFLHDFGIKVPDDISIIGFDNIEFSDLFIPKLTTIDNFLFQRCYDAADNLINRIEKGKFKKKLKVLEPVLIKRESVKAV